MGSRSSWEVGANDRIRQLRCVMRRRNWFLASSWLAAFAELPNVVDSPQPSTCRTFGRLHNYLDTLSTSIDRVLPHGVFAVRAASASASASERPCQTTPCAPNNLWSADRSISNLRSAMSCFCLFAHRFGLQNLFLPKSKECSQVRAVSRAIPWALGGYSRPLHWGDLPARFGSTASNLRQPPASIRRAKRVPYAVADGLATLAGRWRRRKTENAGCVMGHCHCHWSWREV